MSSSYTIKEKMAIAREIVLQIRASDRMAMFAWGVRRVTMISGTDSSRSVAGISFRVNGRKFRGLVSVMYMMNDTYEVTIGKKNFDDVYADSLMELIDSVVER